MGEYLTANPEEPWLLAILSFQLETQYSLPRGLACDSTQVHQCPSPDHTNSKGVLGTQSVEKGWEGDSWAASDQTPH